VCAAYVKGLDEVCSSLDLCLVSLDRLTKIIEPVFAGCPGTANLLLRYFSLIDDNAARIKNNAIMMKQAIRGMDDKIAPS
jgi:hypothetical protein